MGNSHYYKGTDMENTNNGKARINNSISGMSISIPSKKNWFALIFGTLWLGGWGSALGMVSQTFLVDINGFNLGEAGEAEWGGLFVIFWLILWVLGGLMIVVLLAWGYFGNESFQIENDRVIFQKGAFGIGRKRNLQKSEVKNFRFNPVETSIFSTRNRWAFWGLGQGKIKFDYGMKTYSFGLALDDAEANYLVEKLNAELC